MLVHFIISFIHTFSALLVLEEKEKQNVKHYEICSRLRMGCDTSEYLLDWTDLMCYVAQAVCRTHLGA